jgi:hypothetical protein
MRIFFKALIIKGGNLIILKTKDFPNRKPFVYYPLLNHTCLLGVKKVCW